MIELIAWMQLAWKLLLRNSGWMAWNLFLALVPLLISFWLFGQPRSRLLRWGVGFLTGVTFVYGVTRIYDFWHLIQLSRDLRETYLDLDAIYLVGAVAIVLFLMALDFRLLRGRGVRSVSWWVGFLIFIAFLPNAPYVLTDIIHLIDGIRRYSSISVWTIALTLIPQYLLFTIVGFEAYVLSLIYLGDYLRRQGWARYIFWVELTLHALNSIGIYLGRFQRFNSWHIITQPDALFGSLMEDLVGKRPAVAMAATFVVITILYSIMKPVSLGIMNQRQSAIGPTKTSSQTESSIT